MSASEWEGILREGEKVLWQGQPDPRFYIDPSRRTAFGTGVFFSVVGLAILVAALANGVFFGAIFALVFTGTGLYFAFSQSWWPNHKRRHTFYSLTNQRAILGLALPGRERSLKTFEITPDGKYEHHVGPPGSVVFAYEDEGVQVNERTQYFAAGFLRIRDDRKVWGLVRGLQDEMRAKKKELSA